MPYYYELLLFHTGGELTCTIARPNPPPPFSPFASTYFLPHPTLPPSTNATIPSVYNLPSCRFNFHAALKDP